MTMNAISQVLVFVVVLLGLTKPLGWYMARVYEGKPIGLDCLLGPVERALYRLCGVRPDEEMNWKNYGAAMLLFNAAGGSSFSMACSVCRVFCPSTRPTLVASHPIWPSTRRRVS